MSGGRPSDKLNDLQKQQIEKVMREGHRTPAEVHAALGLKGPLIRSRFTGLINAMLASGQILPHTDGRNYFKDEIIR